ncbi:MAG: hypothetical protein IJ809_03660 [Clostridia bacterium]|nr:hypothetical protein [Clostridia bacterium]
MWRTSIKISLFINCLLLLTLFLTSLYLVFKFTEPFYSKAFSDSDNNLVKDELVISELQESINKYYEYIYFGQYEKSKHVTSIISRRTNEDYAKKKKDLESSGEFEVIVKYAYRLYLDTYRCYVVLNNKLSSDNSYIVETNKDNMVQIVISLDRFTNNFTIVTDGTFER